MTKPTKRKHASKSLFAGPCKLPELCEPYEAQRRMALALVLGEFVSIPMFMRDAVIQQVTVMLREKLTMREKDWKQIAEAARGASDKIKGGENK